MKALLQLSLFMSYLVLPGSTLSASSITTIVDNICVSGSACSPTLRVLLQLPRWPHVQEDVFFSIDAGVTCIEGNGACSFVFRLSARVFAGARLPFDDGHPSNWMLQSNVSIMVSPRDLSSFGFLGRNSHCLWVGRPCLGQYIKTFGVRGCRVSFGLSTELPQRI